VNEPAIARKRPEPEAAIPQDVVAMRLGNALVAEHRITPQVLQRVLSRRAKASYPGWVLVEAGVLVEGRWAELIASHFGLASGRIADFTIDRALVAKVSEEFARKHNVLPLCTAGTEIYVAIADPTQLAAFDHLRRLLGGSITPIVVAPSELESTYEFIYLKQDETGFENVTADELTDLTPAELAKLREEGESGEAVRLLDRLMAHAIACNASDIHIETGMSDVRVRFRVDGLLREGPRFATVMGLFLVSRVKVLAQLDISERWKPQDGRVRIRRDGRDLDLRVSVVPVARGEKVVIRLLSAGRSRALGELNLDPNVVDAFRAEMARPNGMVLVTGPTGSGKTSTLYGLLMDRARPDTNVVTIEDPIEYELEGLNQIPINPKRGITFALALRAILRQDPNVILVGEIRDQETATIACEAALTGHLLLSTLHTNDAATSVARLVEMGVPRFLVASVLNAVVAQRLIRRNCASCVEDYVPTGDELRAIGSGLDALIGSGVRLARGRGCTRCEGSGYRGRIPIVEMMTVDDAMRDMIVAGASTQQIAAHAVSRGMCDLRTAALQRLVVGETTIAEVMRVAMGPRGTGGSP
jgi:type IV pilus assembly protein PilB